MNELIKVTEKDGKQVVSARELYEFLGLDKSQWARWYKTNILENPFALKDVDYVGFDIVSNGNLTKDFALTLDFAKRVAMLTRSEKGEQVRVYFVECEKKLKDTLPTFEIPKTFSEALMLAAKQAEQIEQQQKQIETQKPKVDFFDAVAESKDAVDMGTCAKVLNLGIGRNQLFELLRNEKVLMDNNQPYQSMIDRGYFRVVEQKYTRTNGDLCINFKTLVYQKGLDYILKLCKEKMK